MKSNVNRSAILLRLSKMSGLDAAYFLSGGFWLFVYQVISILLGIGTSILLARFFTVAEFGQYQGILSIFGILTIFSLPGATLAMQQALLHKKPGSIAIITNYRFYFGFLGLIGALIASAYFFMHDGDVFGYACIILGITFPVLFSISYMSVYFQTRGNFFYSIVVLLAEKFFIAIAIVISALFFAQTLWLVLLHFIFYCAINAVAYFWFTKHVKTLGKARDTGIEKFSFTNTASLIIPKVLGNLDKLILGYFLGAPILAIYAIGLLIFDTFDGLLNLMQNVITKKMAKMPSINILKKYFSFVPFSFFVGMSLIGMLACYIGIPILYGEAYAESVYVGQLLCITLPFLMLWKLTTNWMGVNNKHKDYMLFTNCYYICNVIFVFISLYLYTSVLALVIAKIVLGVCFFGFSIYYLSSGEKSKSKYSVV